jgi:tRNA threonylcarbamoyladenosine biosynthesis protein TsaB
VADRTITLAIETSNASAGAAGVALGDSGNGPPQTIGVEAVREATRQDDDLLPAIDRLAARLGIRPRDITRVAVSIGPGGYTAVRTAVAAGKMIAEAVGARCIGVPTALVAARRIQPDGHPFAVCLASKGDSTYAAVFDGSGRETESRGIISAADLPGMKIHRLAADSFLPAAIRAEAVAAGLQVVPLILDPAACFEASLNLPEIDPVELLPLYPREPDAVTQWRKRGTHK